MSDFEGFGENGDDEASLLKKHSNAFLNTHTKVLLTLTRRLEKVRELVATEELKANLSSTKSLFVALLRRVHNLHTFLSALEIVLTNKGRLPEYEEEDYEIISEESKGNSAFANEILTDIGAFIRPKGKVSAAYHSICSILQELKSSQKKLESLHITGNSFSNIDIAATNCLQSMDDILEKLRHKSSGFSTTGNAIIAAIRWKRKAGVAQRQ